MCRVLASEQGSERDHTLGRLLSLSCVHEGAGAVVGFTAMDSTSGAIPPTRQKNEKSPDPPPAPSPPSQHQRYPRIQWARCAVL